ncbi:MAG: bifunctional phosphopantothenoylcysteine decarboxylase/phosphopantothenate--cysteine ligase CoaBC [Bacteroidetes bacterium]|nr:bifunctional phosphopantothenoylcysteine decarboxylase/phosphopantothenate--cysteine ligase CoaBC [Bacteroidota bacterium]
MLNKKRILLGITGSIATYKTPILVRELQKKGAEVHIVATPSALEFASKLVLSNLTHNEIISDIFANDLQCKGAWHIELANWCDMMLIAPCSATTLSKLATGNADNPVSCLALAMPTNKPLIIAPAMDFVMYENQATKNNIDILKNRNVNFIEPEIGELASGLVGKGRLPDYDVIISHIENVFDNKLSGFNVLITAGGTHEKIDDVRFISNNSSGKMGYAIAEVCVSMGANVTLISANVNLKKINVNNFIEVSSANEMFEATKKHYENKDIIIMCAAISDYTPESYVQGKIKKDSEELVIKLKRTEDILKWLGTNRTNKNKVIVGFALETSNNVELAKMKLNNKKCDMLVLNSIYGEQSGFGSDYNTITILDKNNNINIYEPMPKFNCAKIIIDNIEKFLLK